MRLIVRNVKDISFEVASKPYCVDATIEGAEPENILEQVDIITAIDYYGITKLLNTIGEDILRAYLNKNNGPGVSKNELSAFMI